MQTFQIEQNVRTLVDGQLENLGWNLQCGEKCNVFQEQPRTNEERKKLKGKRPDYVLYSSKETHRKEPLVIIETKKPGVNLNEAIRQGNWYAEQLSAPIVFATDGIYYKTLHAKFQKPLYLNSEEVDELIRELEALKFLKNNEVETISTEVKYSRQELIKIFEDANNLLRDEGLRAGIERFGEFANILFLKLLGEIEDLKEEQGEEFLVSRDFRWNHWKNKNGDELLGFVNDTVLKETGRVFQDSNIFKPLAIKNPTILKKIIDKLESLKLINIDSDIKGDSFEYFLKQSTATKNDLGEYFTPRHIVKTMVKLVNPQFGERIYDPFCGTGGMLIESFRHIYNNMPRNKRNLKILREETIFGNEITSTARITKMNMILIGDGHSGIQQKNSLADPDSIKDKYDIVITNMPYSQKTEYGSYYDLPSNRGDSVCIQHCIKAIDKMSEKGRIAVIVPEGFLFRKDMQKTREYLLDRCYLRSVISLPQGAFLPYTGVKTNILYCTDIKKKIKQEKFWYFDVKNDGYSLDRHRRKIEGTNDLQKFLAYRNTDVQEKKDVLEIGFSEISMDEVKKNDYILSGNRYKKIFDYSNVKWEVVKIGNVFETTSGGTPLRSNKNYYLNGKIPWLKSGEVSQGEIYKSEEFITELGLKESSAKVLPVNTVLVAMYGVTAGQVGLLKIEATTNQAICGILPNEKAIPKYLYWILKSQYKELLSLSIGGAQPNISQMIIKNLKIPLPPIKIQQEIANELDSYQKIINHARGMMEEYKPQIDIEENWEIVSLEKLGDFQYGFTTTAKEKGDVRFIRITDIDENGKLKDDDIKYIKLSKDNKQYKLTKGDLLVARTGATFGKTLLFQEDSQAIFASYLIRIALDPTKIIPSFYWIFAQSDDYWRQATSLVGGTGQPQFNANVIKRLKVPIPPLEKQKEISEKIKAEQELIESNSEIIKTFKDKIQEKLNFIWGK